MPQVVPCPACGQHLKLPDGLLGQVRQSVVSHVFVAPPPVTSCPVCGGGMTQASTACPDCGYQSAVLAVPSKLDADDKPNVCPNSSCGTLNPPGERLCQRCNTPLPGAIGQVIAGKFRIDQALATGGIRHRLSSH